MDMLPVILFCEENCFLASRAYAQRYPNRNLPDKLSLKKYFSISQNYGNVVYKNLVGRNLLLENEFAVIGSFIENPYRYLSTSERKINERTTSSFFLIE